MMKNFSNILKIKWTNHGNFFLTFVRRIYFLIATVVVCREIYQGYMKFKKEDVSNRKENRAFDNLRYPSITFCYKYKHGSKHIFNYQQSSVYEQAKKKGK